MICLVICVIHNTFSSKLHKHVGMLDVNEYVLFGNKAKEPISKRVFQENKAHQIFRKPNISYPLVRVRIRG